MGHDAAGAVSLSDTGPDTAGAPSFVYDAPEPVIAGQSWSASAWVSGSVTGDVRIALFWQDSAGDYLGSTESSQAPTGTDGWTDLSVTASPPPGAAYAMVALKSSYNPGTVWFDDVTVEAGH